MNQKGWRLVAAVAIILLFGVAVFATTRARDFLTLCTANESIHQLLESSYEIPQDFEDHETYRVMARDLRILFGDFRTSLPPRLTDEGAEVVAYYSALEGAETQEDVQAVFNDRSDDFSNALTQLDTHVSERCGTELLPSPAASEDSQS